VPELPDFSRWGPVERKPFRSVRKATARQMSLSWSQIPHVMHREMADITELEQFRKEQRATVEEQGGKLTLTVLIMKALIAALKKFPDFNASLDEENGEIVVKEYHHIGVAVSTEQGLLVPVIRDADSKSVAELAVELTGLAERTRQGDIKREEMQGGTFTLTNPGPIGGDSFTPIINYPEAAILGVGSARLEPVVRGDLDNFEMVPRLRVPLCLVYDHRLNDGASAARFLRTIVETLQDPDSFLLAV
jgi:pyruvate dehydrogenase E2 component (dihydrolipoamide acetyltransferase)